MSSSTSSSASGPYVQTESPLRTHNCPNSRHPQAWYLWMQNDTIATGIMSFVMHELVYFGRSLPWMLIDAIPYFNKYKLQNVSPYPIIPGKAGHF